MHPALAKHDILLEIFNHLSLAPNTPSLDTPRRPYTYWGPIEITSQRWLLCGPETDEDKLKRTTLASAAQTCKTFSELALDELWAAPRGGIYTLLGLLSGFTKRSETHHTYRFGIKAHSVDRFTLDGEIASHEWITFLRYAARVRQFAFHTYHQPAWVPYYIDDSVCNIICERLAGQPLFARLQCLAWQATTQSRDGCGKGTLSRLLHAILLAPNLSVLAFWDPLRYGGCRPFIGYSTASLPKEQLDMAVGTCSSLHSIMIECFLNRSSHVSSMDQFRHLRTAEISYANWDTLTCLGRLPKLQELRGGLSKEVAQDGGESEQESERRGHNFAENLPTMFTALRRVSLDHGGIESFNRFLSIISSRTLTSLTFRTDTHDGQLRPEVGCIRTICSSPFAASLRVLEMRFDQWRESPGEMSNIPFMHQLEPLLNLHKIQSLSITVSREPMSMSEKNIERMAISWPCISSLKLVTHKLQCPRGTGPEVTHTGHSTEVPPLAALVSLAECCRRLGTLHLPVRDITDDELRELATRVLPAVPQDRLTEVVLGGRCCEPPVVSDVARLEEALRHVFPSIKRVILVSNLDV